MPFLRDIIFALQSVYIPRGSIQDPNTKKAILDALEERQRKIEDEGSPLSPVAVFAEGTTTNGKYLANFK